MQAKETLRLNTVKVSLSCAIQVLVRTQQAYLLVPYFTANISACSLIYEQKNHSVNRQLLIHVQWAFGATPLYTPKLFLKFKEKVSI